MLLLIDTYIITYLYFLVGLTRYKTSQSDEVISQSQMSVMVTINTGQFGADCCITVVFETLLAGSNEQCGAVVGLIIIITVEGAEP